MKNYEVYLTDDAGHRITLLNNFAFISISRTVTGYGTLHIGIPFDDFKIRPVFLPDRRIEVWRSPGHGFAMREEGSFFLRKYNVYTREEDNVEIVEFWGRSPIDILRRQPVTSSTPSQYNKTAAIDDMMKEIVTENFITTPQTAPVGELTVDGDEGIGPTISHSFYGQNVLDVLKDLCDISISQNEADPSVERIYFDVVRGAPLDNGGFGYIFRTFAGLRGSNRTKGTVFSIDNGNMRSPSYFEDHLDSVTMATVLSQVSANLDGSAQHPDRYLSRWNDIRVSQQSGESSTNINDARANQMLQDGKSEKSLNVTFLDSPGSSVQPRSLYGVDWDLGDLLPVHYADLVFTSEVKVVYVSVDDGGKENIVGMSQLRTPLSDLSYEIDCLVVAGGGGGGADNGGGGGSGGVIIGQKTLVPGLQYTITVGAGGAGAVSGTAKGSNGNDSIFSTFIAEGGGGGGAGGTNTIGADGGSGGGGGGQTASPAGGAGTVDQGNNGGAGSPGTGAGDRAGGGGGGAGAVGVDGTNSASGNGGAGIASSITGTSVTYAGGGGGGTETGNTVGSGGAGGGGAGGGQLAAGTAGTANTGGGGGGSGNGFTTGANGGSGIVILRLLTDIYTGVHTGSPTETVDGLFTVVTFTANGTYTA